MAYLLHSHPDRFYVQPSAPGSARILSIDRKTCEMTTVESLSQSSGGTTLVIDGIVGIAKLLRGRYLVVINTSRVVANVNGADIRQALRCRILPFSNNKLEDDLPSPGIRADEQMYVRMMEGVLSSHTFYFAPHFDLTLNMQQIADVQANPERSKMPIWQRADERFFWNKPLAAELIEQRMGDWVTPITSGYVSLHQTHINGHGLSLVIISRRSCKRAGTRYTARGLDTKGNAANFAENEQIIITTDKHTPNVTKIASFLQTRGSIPLLWTQHVTLKYAPVCNISPNSELAFKLHFDEQTKKYGRQVLCNLVNQSGKERAMEMGYAAQVAASKNPDLHYIAFDFHKQAKQIHTLLDQVQDEWDRMGYFMAERPTDQPSAPWTVKKRQNGVIRSNCMDCLDRTNVAQSMFAKKVLARQLREFGILPPANDPMDTRAIDEQTNFVFIWRNTWADNADYMSVQYAGTGALKTDMTRTGKRTFKGMINDGVNSLTRYYLNNFRDGFNQDSLDLFLGLYSPSSSRPSPFPNGRSGFSQVAVFMAKIALLLFAFLVLWAKLAPPALAPYAEFSMLVNFCLFFVLFVVIVRPLLLRDGRRYTNRAVFLPAIATSTSSYFAGVAAKPGDEEDPTHHH